MTLSASHTVNLIYRVAASRAAVTSVETADSSPALLRAPPPRLTGPFPAPSSPTSPPARPPLAMSSPPVPQSLSRSLSPAPGVWWRKPLTGCHGWTAAMSSSFRLYFRYLQGPGCGNVPKQPPAVGHPGKAEGGAGCKAEGGRGGAVAPVKMN